MVLISQAPWKVPQEVCGAHFENHRSRVMIPGAARGVGRSGWSLMGKGSSTSCCPSSDTTVPAPIIRPPLHSRGKCPPPPRAAPPSIPALSEATNGNLLALSRSCSKSSSSWAQALREDHVSLLWTSCPLSISVPASPHSQHPHRT